MRRYFLTAAAIKLRLRLDACRVLAQIPHLAAYASLHHGRTEARYLRVLSHLSNGR